MAKPVEVYVNQVKCKILSLPEEVFGYDKKFLVGDIITCDVVEFRAKASEHEPEEVYTEYRYSEEPDFYFLAQEVEVLED